MVNVTETGIFGKNDYKISLNLFIFICGICVSNFFGHAYAK